MAAKYTVEFYQLDVINHTFTRIDIVDTFLDLSFYQKLNGIGSCRFKLSVYDPHASTINLKCFINQIVVKRNGIIKWFGPLTKIHSKFSKDGGYINIEAQTHLHHFKNRYTQKLKTYTQIDAGAMAWDLINYTQSQNNGWLGVMQGTITPSYLIDKTHERKSIADAIIELSTLLVQVDFNFDYVIDSNGVLTSIRFNVFYPFLGTFQNNLNPLVLGDNVQTYELLTDDEIYNACYSIAQGTGSPLEFDGENLQSEIGFTRREYILTKKGISVYTDLQNVTSQFLKIKSVSNLLFEATLVQDSHPSIDDFGIGDVLNVNLSLPNGSSFLKQNRMTRVIELSIDVDVNGKENIIPKLQIVG